MIENTVLFGKYLVLQIIGSGGLGTVFLVKHIELAEYRVAKRIAKDDVSYAQFRKEALCMKQLSHPGIPIVYDLEEDSEFYYLFEEYLEGETLFDLVKNQGPLSPDAVVAYGIQICELVHYLHSTGTSPILHLDLQPKNILLSHETIKLIDFNCASTIQQANQIKQRFGTIGYAAPEQYTTESLDERTDIFSIGIILYFLGKGSFPNDISAISDRFWDASLFLVIKKCLNREKEERYQSVKQLWKSLESTKRNRTGVFHNTEISSLIIAIVTSRSGAGATHLAIGLSVYLKQQGYPNLYEEWNDSQDVESMAGYFGIIKDQYGLVNIGGVICKPHYGKAIKLKENPYRIILRDFGADWEQAESQFADLFILVNDSQVWEQNGAREAVEYWLQKPNVIIAYRQRSERYKIKLSSKLTPDQCFLMPYHPDPFQISDNERFYQSLSKSIFMGRGEWKRQGFFKKIVGIIKRIR